MKEIGCCKQIKTRDFLHRISKHCICFSASCLSVSKAWYFSFLENRIYQWANTRLVYLFFIYIFFTYSFVWNSLKAKSKLKSCISMYLVKSTFYLDSLTMTVELSYTYIMSSFFFSNSFLDNGLFRITTHIFGASFGLN